MTRSILRLLLFLVLASTAAHAQGPTDPVDRAEANTAASPTEARQALEVLQDPVQRDRLIETLKTIAEAGGTASQATPAQSRAPETRPPPALGTSSLGAQLLSQLGRWTRDLSNEATSAARMAADLPLLWPRVQHLSTDPGARAGLIDAGWRVVFILGCALAVEWVVRRSTRRLLAPLAGLSRGGPAAGADEAAMRDAAARRRLSAVNARTMLRRLPVGLAVLALALAPVAAFFVAGILLLSAGIAPGPNAHAAVLTVVYAYALARATMCGTRALVSPADGRLRLLPVSDETAGYSERWTRRIVVTAVGGGALADLAMLFGLNAAAHDVLTKLVALIVHLLLAVIVLQRRGAVAAWMRAPAGAAGWSAAVRNRLAETWHYIAIFFIAALWVVWALQIENGLSRLVAFSFGTAAVLIVSRLVSAVSLAALDRLFGDADLRSRFPGVEQRVSRYHAPLRGVISAAVLVVTALALLEVWGVDVLAWFGHGKLGGRLLSAVVTIGVAAAAAIAVWEAANAMMDRHLSRLTSSAESARAARIRTLFPMLRTALFAAVLAVVGLTALSELGVNVAPLLAGAGIVGIAVGFGSQKLVQDIITGLFLLLENAMQVGDWVTVSGVSGSVENLSLRTIRLRATDGSVHIIPFSSITGVTNRYRGAGNVVVSVSVAYKEDTDRVGTVLESIAAEMRHEVEYKPLMRGDLELQGVDKVSATSVTISGQIACTAAGRRRVEREFNRRMKRRFQEQSIEIANP